MTGVIAAGRPMSEAGASIETLIEAAGWAQVDDASALAARAYAATVGAAPAAAGGVALLLTDDEKMRALNNDFRNKDRPTNVLSFPSGAPAPGFIGDIALGLETCLREAAETGTGLADHATHLIVHGLLHLIGYDHQTDEDAEEMEAMEIDILAGLGIENPYMTRNAKPGASPDAIDARPPGDGA